MKLLVLSDSHGCVDNVLRIVEIEKPDKVLHLGDGRRDFEALERKYYTLPMVGLIGNCDFAMNGPSDYSECMDGVTIYACHGHRYQVKAGLQWLRYAAMEREAKLCLYGHTHIPAIEEADGITYLNPGACGGYSSYYAVVELLNGEFHCEIKMLRN